ncbi:DUF2236 domain-containing protein [Nocardia sp. NBC_01730]|uniref:oxygenase MpaB family protein n=1 Tax=Nocardia sp. NBC_01730 TaxID=2975998 RepID=UPI002E11E931|nr:DUF2236 domain-containing protein [Nocardia sp. NBC_01730]
MTTHQQRLPDLPLLTEFPVTLTTKMLAPSDIHATAAQRDAYLRYTRMGDPNADALVAMLRRFPAGHGRAMFENAVENGITAVEDPPRELVEFFAHIDTVPYWVDVGQLDHACRVIGRTGLIGFASLSMVGLMGGYLASRVVKTLVRTGDLERMAPRRIAETTTWFTQVTSQGGLDRFAPGFKATIRVRLMHAMVRAGMTRREDWNFTAWDHPINQSTLAGTTMLFAIAHMAGSQALGIHFSRHDKDAIYHLWRYTGYLLGVDQEILPTNDRDYWRMLWLQTHHEFGHPDQDSIRLAQAFLRAIGPAVAGDSTNMASRFGRNVVSGIACAYARSVLGRRNADFLEIPDSAAFHVVVIVFAVIITALEYPRRLLPGATGWAEKHGQRSRLRLMKRMMLSQSGQLNFHRHDHLGDYVQRAAADTVA